MCLCLSEGKLPHLFCQLNLILVELWSICYWPSYLWTLHADFFQLPSVNFYFSLPPQEFNILIPVTFWLPLSHFLFVLFFCIPYRCLSWEFCCCVCVCFFCSHLFCCFTSVKSAADVHLISYNTLIINRASLVHQPRHRHEIWPNKGPTYDIRF